MLKIRKHDRIDWISNLSDDILIHILSLLTSKEAVQTCLLSRRWSRVWASMPDLEFHVDDFSENKGVASRNENCRIYEDRLMRFVIGVLKNRKSSPVPLDTFTYFCRKKDANWQQRNVDCHSVEWLDCVTALMPRVIRIHVGIPRGSHFPDSIFSCASLEELELYTYPLCPRAIRAKSINLPSLKVLELGYMRLSNDLINIVLIGCPSLERLILGPYILGITAITSDRLKALDIYSLTPQNTQISCPALVSFSGNFAAPTGTILLNNMPSVEYAAIEVFGESRDVATLSGLKALSNAATIKLLGCRRLKGLLERDIPNCRTFNNLKRLEIGHWDMINDFDLIACFLEKSPNLQELTLHTKNAYMQEQPAGLRRDGFVCEHLAKVRISCQSEIEQSKLIEVLHRHIKTIGNIVV